MLALRVTASVDLLMTSVLAADDEDEWPPFRKAGVFDPYTDDPRLGVQRIFLCPVSDILVVAGTAGQVIVLQMEREDRELDLRV